MLSAQIVDNLGTENYQKGEIGHKGAVSILGLQFFCVKPYASTTHLSAQIALAEWYMHTDICNRLCDFVLQLVLAHVCWPGSWAYWAMGSDYSSVLHSLEADDHQVSGLFFPEFSNMLGHHDVHSGG